MVGFSVGYTVGFIVDILSHDTYNDFTVKLVFTLQIPIKSEYLFPPLMSSLSFTCNMRLLLNIIFHDVSRINSIFNQ